MRFEITPCHTTPGPEKDPDHDSWFYAQVGNIRDTITITDFGTVVLFLNAIFPFRCSMVPWPCWI